MVQRAEAVNNWLRTPLQTNLPAPIARSNCHTLMLLLGTHDNALTTFMAFRLPHSSNQLFVNAGFF
jgi:hypothetical protein